MEKLRKILIDVIAKKQDVEVLLNEIILTENKKSNLEINLIIVEFEDPFNSYTENQTIFIKKRLLEAVDLSNNLTKKNNIFWLLKNIYHEIAHIYQKYDAEQGIISDKSMLYITTNLIHDYLDEEEYVRNYYYQEIEINANEIAWLELLNLLNNENQFLEIIKQIKLEQEKLEIAKLVLERITKDNKMISAWIIFPLNLNKALKNNPIILKKYLCLNVFYHKNGTPKSLIEILAEINLANHYSTTKLWLNRMFFLKVINQNLQELDNAELKIKKRYSLLLEKMKEDFYINDNKLKKITPELVSFTKEEYKHVTSIIKDKMINLS